MKLHAEKREVAGKKVKGLRKQGVVPASLFGAGIEPTNIQVNEKELKKIYEKAGQSRFIDLEVGESKPAKVLIKEIAIHPIKDNVLNVGFYKVREDRKITVEVPIAFEGVSPAEAQKLGFIVHQMEELAVHCFPKDLPTGFTVDISTLEKPGDSISVSDIQLPEDVELDSSIDPSSAIIYVAAPQKEEEIVEEAPVEGEEGAEGEAATTEGGEAPAEEKAE